MKKNLVKIAALALCATMAVACSKSKEYYEIPPGPDGEPIENPGQIVIPDDIPLPPGITITIIDEDGNKTDIKPGQSLDVEAGTYQLVVTENATGMTVDGLLAYLPAASDGLLPVAPELRADVVTVTVTKGKVSIPQINLRPMTREVQMQVDITGITAEQIAGIKVTLYGVANSVNLAQGFGAVSAAGDYHTVVSSSPMNMRILGVAPSADLKVSFEVTTSGGDVHSLVLDANQVLGAFNNGSPASPQVVKVGLHIDVEVGDMTGRIKEWNDGGEVEIEGE